MRNEIEILERIKAKEPAALDDLMTLHGRLVYHQALTTLRNQADADDVYQEVFTRVYRFAESCRGSSVKAWISRITFNCCMDLIARNKKQQKIEEVAKETGPACHCESSHETSFADLIASCSSSEKEILTMRFVSQLSYAEIAEEKGLTEGTLRNLICRILKHLRKEMNE